MLPAVQGLSAADERTARAGLARSHLTRSRVTVYDRDENALLVISDRLNTGSVQVDTSQPIDRALTLELIDADRKFMFVPGGPGEASLFADNFLGVSRGSYVADLGRWVDWQVFHGPITSVSHDGSSINIEAVGKESLALAPAVAWEPFSIPKGTLITDAIHRLLAAQGEGHFDFPALTARLQHPVSVARSSEPWKIASRLAGSIDRQLFYDGKGAARLRAWPDHPAFKFRTGAVADPLRNVLTRPQKTFDIDKVRNVVEALGPKPTGTAKRLRYVATPPRGNPLSPWSLSRNSQPRFLVEHIDMPHAKRERQLRNRAERELDQLMRADLGVTFDALPMPFLEPGDMVGLNDFGELSEFVMRQFTIPLISDVMSVGYTKRISGRGRQS